MNSGTWRRWAADVFREVSYPFANPLVTGAILAVIAAKWIFMAEMRQNEGGGASFATLLASVGLLAGRINGKCRNCFFICDGNANI